MLFVNATNFSVNLLTLSKKLEQHGQSLKYQKELEKLAAKAQTLCGDNETFYESEAYHQITQKAVKEYDKGLAEKWPA